MRVGGSSAEAPRARAARLHRLGASRAPVLAALALATAASATEARAQSAATEVGAGAPNASTNVGTPGSPNDGAIDVGATEVASEAPAKPDKPPAWETAKPEHRGGFAMGIALGAGFGASNGFPNDSAKIGHDKYYTESGIGFALGSTVWIGGSLADWLTFGAGFGYSNILAPGSTSPAPFATFHTDVYPLYPLGKAWRDLGAMLEFGLGFPKTIDTKTEEAVVDGAGSSYIFAGAVWEGFAVWKLRMGPYAGVHYMFSDSVRRPAGMVGFRMSLYTAP